jgi:putrescine transport system substrate-binding protein
MMKRCLVKWLLPAAVAVGLGAGVQAPADADDGKVVNIYNWSDYMDPQVIEDFTRDTGIRVVYDVYDDNKLLETKLLIGGSGYDVVVPTAYFLQRQIPVGVFMKLDKAKLPNLKNLDPDIQKRMERYDPGNQHAFNNMWGTTGIGYNKEKVAARLGGQVPESWSLVFDPAIAAKLKDCGIVFLDAPDDVFPAALAYLGLNPDSKDPADFNRAAELVARVRPFVRQFTSSAYVDALANGDVCVAIGWSGDILQARDRAREAAQKLGKPGPEIVYLLPKEGAQIWFDSFAIPADAPHKDEAHAFLDYLMRADVAARNSNYVRYASGNRAADPLIDPALRQDPSVYPDPATMARLYAITAYDQAAMRALNRSWTKLRTGQ